MNLKDLDISNAIKLERPNHNVKCELYHDDKFYYKLITQFSPYNRTSLAYYTFDGLSFIWMGDDEISANKLGLINTEIIPAFVDYIYDNGVCVGYVTHKGTSLNNVQITDSLNLRYLKYLNKLVDHSIEQGWGYVSVGINNIIEYDGKLSFIDLDFSPIKLHHGLQLTTREQLVWDNEFRSSDGIYLEMIKRKLW